MYKPCYRYRVNNTIALEINHLFNNSHEAYRAACDNMPYPEFIVYPSIKIAEVDKR